MGEYMGVYCGECGWEVCGVCGCCYNSSCVSASCPAVVEEESYSENYSMVEKN